MVLYLFCAKIFHKKKTVQCTASWIVEVVTFDAHRSRSDKHLSIVKNQFTSIGWLWTSLLLAARRQVERMRKSGNHNLLLLAGKNKSLTSDDLCPSLERPYRPWMLSAEERHFISRWASQSNGTAAKLDQVTHVKGKEKKTCQQKDLYKQLLTVVPLMVCLRNLKKTQYAIEDGDGCLAKIFWCFETWGGSLEHLLVVLSYPEAGTVQMMARSAPGFVHQKGCLKGLKHPKCWRAPVGRIGCADMFTKKALMLSKLVNHSCQCVSNTMFFWGEPTSQLGHVSTRQLPGTIITPLPTRHSLGLIFTSWGWDYNPLVDFDVLKTKVIFGRWLCRDSGTRKNG